MKETSGLNKSEDAAPQAVALVGGGKGGHAVLAMLMQMPAVRILYVCDVDPEAPAIHLAKVHGIPCSHDPEFSELARNAEVELILEITGRADVFQKLAELKHPDTSLIGAAGNRFLFELLEIQELAKADLRAYQATLEERIADRTRDLQQANQLLRDQVMEHERLNEKLQQINDQKTKYLLRSTHQLKAPFAAIQSYADVILDGFTGDIPDKTERIMLKIKQRCAMLSETIREMLELANLRSVVDENVQKTDVSISSILKEVVDKAEVLATEKDIPIRFHPLAGDSDSISCNRDQMDILFSLLLVNAINYSAESDLIEVAVTEEGASTVVSVTDHGIGISEENLDRIFREYFRSNRAAAHHSGGSGLGLAIANEIVKLHSFQLRVESVVGEGSTFSVVMPR